MFVFPPKENSTVVWLVWMIHGDVPKYVITFAFCLQWKISSKIHNFGPLQVPAAMCWRYLDHREQESKKGFLPDTGTIWPGLIPQRQNMNKRLYKAALCDKQTKCTHPITTQFLPIPCSAGASTVAEMPTALCMAGHQSVWTGARVLALWGI